MRKRNHLLFCLLALILAAALAGCASGGEEAALETAPVPTAATTPEPTPEPGPDLSIASQSGHPALIALKPDGTFDPDRGVSKSQFCQALYGLLDGLSRGSVSFSDFKVWNAGYAETAALYAAGLLPEEAGQAFYPARFITRWEAAYILEQLSACLEGEEAARAAALAADVRAGATSRAGASDNEDETILRDEFAVILERLLGRQPDETALFLNELIPADMSRDDYAWAYVADAVTEGEIPALEPGVHRAYGTLYATWEDGSLVVDADYGVWTFGLDGSYTTGDEELDGYLKQALEESGANGLPDEEALEAAYLYIKYNFEYLVRPEDAETIEVGVFGWEYERALRFFRYGGGTCYGFAAGFGLLARMLGQNAYVVAAQINQYYAPHGFVIIPADGIDWIYDVELENTRQERHGDLELFHIQNYAIYNYWYIPDWGEE